MTTPPPFTISIDTREQRPLEFPGIQTIRQKLDAGDYGVVLPGGVVAPVAVERKSKTDAWGSMSVGRARFERCVKRLAALDRACIVIECSLDELAIPPVQVKRVLPASVIGGLLSWSCQYAIPVYFCPNREFAARVTIRFLAAWVRHRSGLYLGKQRENK